MTTGASAPPAGLPGHAPAASASWREKALPLLIGIGLVCLLFRPLLLLDYLALHPAPPVQPVPPVPPPPLPPAPDAWLNLGADLLCFLIACGAVLGLFLSRIGSIAFNTFREAVRNRILYFILFFAILLMAASGVVTQLSIAAHDRIVVDIGLSSISFFGLMAAVFVGISLVYNELERRTIYTIVSKPIHRYQFLLGKFFGLLLTIYLIVAVMTLFFFTVINYQAATTDAQIEKALVVQDGPEKGNPVPNLAAAKIAFLARAGALSLAQGAGSLLGFQAGAVEPRLLVAVAMICLELMIVTALAILFSSFSTPALSAVFTVMLFLAGRLNEDIMRFAERIMGEYMQANRLVNLADLPFSVLFKARLAQVCGLLVPNLDSINVTSGVVHDRDFQVWRFSVLYAICYTAVILLLSILIFRRRNFK